MLDPYPKRNPFGPAKGGDGRGPLKPCIVASSTPIQPFHTLYAYSFFFAIDGGAVPAAWVPASSLKAATTYPTRTMLAATTA